MRRALKLIEIVFYLAFVLTFIGILTYYLGIQPLLGEADQLSIWLCVSLACGGMLMMAVYNTALRLFTRSEKAALYFALFCLGQSSRFFFMKDSIGFQLFPNLPPALAIYGLRYAAFCISLVGLTFFVYEIFGEGRSKKVKYALNVMVVFVSFFIAVAGLEQTIWRSVFWLPAGIIVHVVCIYVIVKSPEFKKNRLSILYLVGFLLYFVSFFITATSLESAPYIAVMFNFVFATIHSILLSDRFARALNAMEQMNVQLEEKVAERTKELTKANMDLSESEKSVREMVSNISHDLKTPMSILSVNLEMLQEDPPSSEAFYRHLNIAYNKSGDLARLTGQLLDAGRMESSGDQNALASMSVAAMLNAVQTKYADLTEEAGVDLIVSYKQDAHVCAEEKKLWSVFDNLLSNALRYTSKGGSISVTAGETQNGFISVTVSDTGCGIEPRHLPRIFERYYKADKSRGDAGTGLGLYIVKTAVEAMGGNIAFESAPDSGTAVTFTLKAAKA